MNSIALIAAIAAIAFYAGGLIQLWRTRSHAHHEPDVMWWVIGALICHGASNWLTLRVTGGINLSLLSASNLVSWVVVAAVAVTTMRLPVQRLYLFLFPLSISILVLLNIVPAHVTPIVVSEPLFIHIVVSLAAYSVLLLAACHSVLLAIQERHLKNPGKPILQLLPPLETMETLLVAMLWIGLILLSASILSGFFFLQDMFAQQVVHHTVLTTASWLVYVFFLAGRHLFGWRGLTAVRWTLCAFALLLLGYVGSKFVLEYLLGP
jgi:ABC-type uncharacterized transport system permease subunit